MDEQQAIQRLKQGDPGGLEYLVHAQQVRATRAAYLILGDWGLAQEIMRKLLSRCERTADGLRIRYGRGDDFAARTAKGKCRAPWT